MSEPKSIESETPAAVAGAAPCSALALDAQNAIKKGDPIGTYDAYAEWLASHERGYVYLKQAISALAWQLHKTGNLPMMRTAVDEVTGAERALVDEKVKAPNIRSCATTNYGHPTTNDPCGVTESANRGWLRRLVRPQRDNHNKT